MSLFSELKRRNVFRVGAAYIVVAWLIIQVAETLFPLFGFGDGPARIVVIVLAIGFIPVLIISWAFELTPDGLKRDGDVDPEFSIAPHTGKKLDRTIMVVLVIALAYFGFDKFVLDPQRDVDITESATRAGAEQAREEARLGMFSDKSVAVLPFANRSERKEDEYFTDGMHDELLTRLSRIAALKVISRTSVMRYRDTEKSIPEIARELSVATILEGGVQRSGKQVRINVQLIDGYTDEHLWAEIYDRELTAENLFAIQSEISSKIAAALHAELSPEEESRIYDLPTSSLEAYNHYMHGRQLLATRRVEDLNKALEAFEQTVAIDPEFALAWVGIADSNYRLRSSGVDYTSESFELRRRAVEKALALDDQLGEAYVSLSVIYFETGEHQKAQAACNKSIELSPNYAQAYLWCAEYLGGLGPAHLEKRLTWYYKAAQLDPLSSGIQNSIGSVLQQLGRDDEALVQYRHLLQVDPGYAPTYASVGSLHQHNGRLAEAVRWYRRALQRDPGSGTYMWDLAGVYIVLGDFESVAGIREKMHAHLDPSDWRFNGLDMYKYLAQGKLHELQSPVDRLPPAVSDRWWVVSLKANFYLLDGDMQKAREYWLRAGADWANPDQWQRLIIANQTNEARLHACNFAGILMGTEDEAAGQDLLRQAIHYYEEIFPGLVLDSHRWQGLGWCYLVKGSFEKALDFFEQRVAHGHISEWWKERYLPWWEPVRDHPRFIAIVNRIDGMLAEQRELLRQMDEAGTTIP